MRHRRLRSLLTGSLFALALAGLPLASRAQISVSITIAPPVLPVYAQPPIPAAGYLWVPGYWAWSDGGYYWVPGTWVEPPEPGLLWTPGYWGWSDGVYVWHEGYWGPVVGFYGGVHYGFGYDGEGYRGGYWSHGAFYYNSAVNRIPPGLHIGHVYRRPVPAITNRVSFNGGAGGLQVHATAAQMAAARAQHLQPVAAQRQQEESAGRNPELRASINHGHPGIAATMRPGQFSGTGVVSARGAPVRANIAHHGAGPGAVARGRAAEGANAAGRAGEAPHTGVGRSAEAGREAPIAAPHGPSPGGESRGVNERGAPQENERNAPRQNERGAPRAQPHGSPARSAAPNAHQGRGGQPAARPEERKPG